MHRFGKFACLATVLALAGCDNGGSNPWPAPTPTPTITPTPEPTPTPTPTTPVAPVVFSSATKATAPENTTAAFYTAIASGNGGPITHVITGGADAGQFTLRTTGELAFKSPHTASAPTDADRDNHYLVTIMATDAVGLTASLALDVTVAATPYGTARLVAQLPQDSQARFVIGLADNSGRILVGGYAGKIYVVDPRTTARSATPFLDVSAEVDIDLNTNGTYGLINAALAPDFDTSREVYVSMTVGATLQIRRYRVFANDRARIDPSSQALVMRIPANRFGILVGGNLAFGPDGYLYIGMGNNDVRSPSDTSFYGKILRIDIKHDDFPDTDRNYAIPSDNPFVGGAAPEIWASNFRMPAGFHIDQQTGDIWVADSGEPSSDDMGKPARFYRIRPQDKGKMAGALRSTWPNTIPAAYEYDTPTGASALKNTFTTGGNLYRGPVQALRQYYPFLQGSLKLNSDGSTVYQTFQVLNVPANERLYYFGEDSARNMYRISLGGRNVYIIE